MGASESAPIVVTPDLRQYGPEFQSRMADELETLPGRQCPREWVTPGCSALWTFTIDSIDLRDRIKAANNAE